MARHICLPYVLSEPTDGSLSIPRETIPDNKHGSDATPTCQNLEIHTPAPLILGTKAIAFLK